MTKAVILAGGYGTRIAEETSDKPKPMVEIGGKPILWHIMKSYSSYGINEFIICCGYKGYVIKEYFSNYFIHMSDITIDMADNSIDVHNKRAENWKVTLLDTGLETMTGGRLLAAKPYLEEEECFFFTYGDGLSDIDFKKELDFHKLHSKIATIAGVVPPGRFGTLDYDGDTVHGFSEKPKSSDLRVNGGFFVLSPKIFDYIRGSSTPFESEPLENLSRSGELKLFKHDGFWQPMDTLREKIFLENLWNTGTAPWRTWVG